MALSPVGIEIMGLSPIEQTSLPKATRVSVGIERLDAMLSGGVFRGSGILISGSPGTAKSTLCGAAVLAACERREKALYISFEELGTELIRNLTSVNINLKKYVASGRLVMHTLRTEAGSASEHFLKIRALLHEHQPDILVIDPISALIKVGGINNAVQITQWLLRLTKSAGVITFLTSLLEQPDASVEDAALPVSTFADCWMHLSYVVQGGERNRALTIVKARGTRHSNQVRELILSDSGITLTDVYLAGGQPLMGAARLEREALEAKTRTEFSLELENRRRNLILAEADLQARMKSMEIELETRRQELKRLSSDEENADAYKEKLLQKLRKIRGADHR
jgi:circadian clock protein KaiC